MKKNTHSKNKCRNSKKRKLEKIGIKIFCGSHEHGFNWDPGLRVGVETVGETHSDYNLIIIIIIIIIIIMIN